MHACVWLGDHFLGSADAAVWDREKDSATSDTSDSDALPQTLKQGSYKRFTPTFTSF